MSIMVVADTKLKAESISAAKEFFAEILTDTRAFEGCEGVTMCIDSEDPAHLILIAKWVSKEHYEKYHNWRLETGFVEQIRELLDGPFNRRFLEIVSE